jgi:two-component system, OmpR family, sensor kinase
MRGPLRSLRWRVLAWHTLILVAVVGVFGGVHYGQVSKARYNEVDAELLASARMLEGALRGVPRQVLEGGEEPFPPPKKGPPKKGPPWKAPEPPEERLRRVLSLPPPDPRRARGEEGDGLYFVVWLADGTILRAVNLPADVKPGPYDRDKIADPAQSEVRQRGDYRELVLTGPALTQIAVGRDIRREINDLQGLAWQLVWTGLVVLAVGLIGGYWLSSRALRPLAAMSATAAGISAANLHERIDLQKVDRELSQLGAVLNDMFARLEAAFERQTRFTADASHELRTPLAVIHSSVELALSKERSTQEYQETLAACARASRRMRAIVDSLMTLARADAGKLQLHLEPIDLGEVVRDAVALLGPLANEKNVALEVQVQALTAVSDGPRLAQVMTNLVTNAIHYNRPGGKVRVTLDQDGAGDNKHAVLQVADTGHGIAEEDRPFVFERFYRVDKARSREHGGSGLGLAICKSIVEGLGGTIAFTTVFDQGTTFVVRLPLGAQAVAVTGSPASSLNHMKE